MYAVGTDVRMINIQDIPKGDQVCRAVGVPPDKSPCLATWMDECSTEDGAIHSLHSAVMSMEAAYDV
jgi:hypothetical protein